MKPASCFLPLVVLAFLAGPSFADRTPSRRVVDVRVPSVRGDITVPYLTTGKSAFGAYKVAPLIYSSPVLEDAAGPGARPTFNLPFYGARMGFGGRSNGATEKPRLLP
jgi:hypothetical protein